MAKLPEFLLKLMHSDAYRNQLHPNYQDVNQRVGRYMQMLFPGKMTYDSAGRLSEPEYDMTLEQFNQAQQQIDADFEDEKQEKEQEVWDEYEETFEIMGYEFDIENFIFPGEQISKRVLYPDGMIITKYLETQIVDVPELKKLMRVWIWHAENGPNMCDECGVRDGAVFFDVADIPSILVHPNCRCRITEDIINQDGKIIQSKEYKIKGNNMSIKEKVLNNELKLSIMQHEGIKPNPYIDSKKYLTIGIGNNIQQLQNFQKLNLVNSKNGHKLTLEEKTELHSKIMVDIKNKTFNESKYLNYQISSEQMLEQFDRQLNQSYRELEQKFNGFSSFPISVQQALVDMQFNMGDIAFQPVSNTIGDRTYTAWPKLFDAISKRDWEKVANESSRKDVGRKRNLWTYEHFMLGL